MTVNVTSGFYYVHQSHRAEPGSRFIGRVNNYVKKMHVLYVKDVCIILFANITSDTSSFPNSHHKEFGLVSCHCQ